MVSAVADRHTALWYLCGDPRLSTAARAFIMDAANERREIAVSSISLAELVYLLEKGRVPAFAYEGMTEALATPEKVFVEAPLTAAFVESMWRVSRAEVPDRIVAATAVHFGVPVISRDRLIRSSGVDTIW